MLHISLRASWLMGGGWLWMWTLLGVPLCHCASLCPLDTKPKKERETRDNADNWSSRDQTVLTMTLFFPSISANPAAKRVDKDW